MLFEIFLTTAVFIPDARPVFSLNVCGTAPSGLKPSAKRRGMIIFQCNVIVMMPAVCYMCVLDVLWMCYESVMRVLWECYECYESVMRALWKRYESVIKVLWKCYESVMKVLWKCYGCVMAVLWVCEECMRDGWMMDILYLLCKLYCKWYCNCDIVVVCDITVMLIFVFCFSGLFINDQ